LNELGFVHEFYEVLDAQILKLKQDQEVKLRKAKQLRDIAFDLIKSKILSVYNSKPDVKEQVKVEVYGSMATGLAIDSSDLDILVHDFVDQNSPRFHQMSRQQLIEEMQVLHHELQDVNGLKNITLIDSASVPVIKL
jgi:predicted nucleotidyltransferase